MATSCLQREVVLCVPKKDQFVAQSEFSGDFVPDCVTVDELDSFFEPPFSHLWNGDNHTYNSQGYGRPKQDNAYTELKLW